MKVLAVASYPVEAAATRYRLTQFVEPLAERGIELTVRPFMSRRLFSGLYRRAEMARTASGLLKSAVFRLGDLRLARNADVLLVQREAMLFGPPLFEWLAMNLGDCPMVLDLDDATYISLASPVYGRFASVLKWRTKTDSLIRWAKVVTCGNSAIAQYVADKGTRSVVIPTVVDTNLFRPASIVKSHPVPVIGWIGTHSTFPYLESLFPLLRRLARIHQFRLRIVGSGRSRIEIEGVEVENLEWKMEREVEDFQSLDIGLYPLAADEWAAGKSGFKAVQYMAVGVPFVVSPVGVCATIGNPETTHFCATTVDEWFASLTKLLSDSALRKRMGEAGRTHVLEHYTVRTQADKLAAALRQALSPAPSGR